MAIFKRPNQLSAVRTSAANQNPYGNGNPMDSATNTPNVSNPINKLTTKAAARSAPANTLQPAAVGGIGGGTSTAYTGPTNTQPFAQISATPTAPQQAPTAPQQASTTPSTFGERWGQSPESQMALAEVESAQTSGQVAQDTMLRQAQQQLALAGIDPSSVAGRKILADAQDRGAENTILAQRSAGSEALGMREEFRDEEKNSAIAAFEMMEPNQLARDALAAELTKPGGDIVGLVGSMTGGEGEERGLLEKWQQDEYFDEGLEAKVEEFKRRFPDASEMEIKQMAEVELQQDLELAAQAQDTAVMEMETRSELFKDNPDTKNITPEAWSFINADQTLKDRLTTGDLGSWWGNYREFSKGHAGAVEGSTIRDKLSENGVVEGAWLDLGDQGMHQVTTSVRIDKINKGKDWKVTFEVYNPLTNSRQTVRYDYNRR